jgi:Putative GTPases (G3E family)
MSCTALFTTHTASSLRQIAGADVILLNKVDLVPATEVSSTETLLHSINPAAPVYTTVRGQVDLKHIMGIGAYASAPKFQWNTPSPNSEPHHITDHDGLIHTHLNERTHYQIRGISSLQVSCPVLPPSRLDNLDEWIRIVLWENRLPESTADLGLQVLRCKGLFTMESGDQYVLQGVRNIYEIAKVGAQDVMGIPEPGKVVLIGKGRDDTVRRSLESAIN